MPVTLQEQQIPHKNPASHIVEEDPRWAAVRDLTHAPSFLRSPRLSQLLLYLATQTLEGRGEAVTEQEIAGRVFARDNNFHPSSDTIVRSHLLRLRQRLQQHHADTASAHDRFQINIPRGQYKVEFHERPIAPRPPAPATATTPPHPAPQRSKAIRWLLLAALCIVILSLYPVLKHRPPAEPPPHPLWTTLFPTGQTTIIIAADSSLVILHQFLRHDTSLADYLSGAYRQDAKAQLNANPVILSVANRRYTSMVDVSIVQHAAELAAARHAAVEARYARELSIEDLKRSNAIVSGSRGANPWVELFEPQMNFLIASDYARGVTVVKNRHPQPGEAAEYVEGSGEPGKPLFGVLAYLPNLEPSRSVLLLEGTSLAATQAIRDLVFDDTSLLPVLGNVRRKDGSLRHFELLLASTVVNGNASKFQILAYRTYD